MQLPAPADNVVLKVIQAPVVGVTPLATTPTQKEEGHQQQPQTVPAGVSHQPQHQPS